MGRLYSEIPKFKHIEASIRETGVKALKAKEAVEQTKGGRHSAKELAALEQVAKDLAAVHSQVQAALHHLYDAFD